MAQHALECSTGHLQRILLDAVLREAPDLRKTRHGKHVAVTATNIARGLAAKKRPAGAGPKQAPLGSA